MGNQAIHGKVGRKITFNNKESGNIAGGTIIEILIILIF